MNKIFKILAAVLIVLAFAVIIGFMYISNGLDAERQPEIRGINPSAVADGTYTGQYKSGRFSNEVSVSVESGKIVDIQILDDVTFANKETSDALFQRVIDQQNTTVDAVSGATVTSKAYLKAIENALNGQH